MALQFSSTIRDNFNTQVINGVGVSGLLKVYQGTIPTNVGTAISGQTLLVSMPCSATFGATSGGVLTVNAVTQTNAVASGTAQFFQVTTSGGVAQYQGTVTATGGGGDLTMANTTITSGGPVQETSWTITAPGA